MSAFEPLTLGYDWEVWALNQSMLPADGKKFDKIADRVNSELYPMEAHREWKFIEVGAGIVQEWPELVERTMRYIDWVRPEFAKEELVFYPCATIVAAEHAAGLHVHVGTTTSSAAAAGILNAMVPYIAPLIALMANSPVCHWRRGIHKAYRSSGFTWGNGGMYPVAQPHLQNNIWDGEMAAQRKCKPTMEVRIADSSLCPRLICEYALVVAGLLDWIGRHADTEPVTFSADEYEEALANRWRASVDGLQATFMRGGREISAVEAVSEIIDKAGAGMRRLSASEEDLTVIPQMLAKRETQADLQIAFMQQYSDLPAFQRTFADVISASSAFEDYLAAAPVLDEIGCRDHDEAVLAMIGKDTKALRLGEFFSLSPVILERKLQRLKDRGLIEITTTPEDGLRCSRIGSRKTVPVAQA